MRNFIVFFSACILLFSPFILKAQVCISTDGTAPHSSAMLEVKSQEKGMLIPRIGTTQRTGMSDPATGLLVYDINTQSFWFRRNDGWIELVDGNVSTLNDSDGDTKVMVEKNQDEDVIRFDLGGTERMVLRSNRLELSFGNNNVNVGPGAGQSLSTGLSNSFFGYRVGYVNSTGSYNTAFGTWALYSSTSAMRNVAAGYQAMYDEEKGFDNTAIGYRAMYNDTSGNHNVAIGARALYYNTDRSFLVAVGDSALFKNGMDANDDYEATGNTALGSRTLVNNTAGAFNTAIGSEAANKNEYGTYNTACGYRSLRSNTWGSGNNAIGALALYLNTTGGGNTAMGSFALFLNTSGECNTSCGYESMLQNIDGDNNVALGYRPLYTNTHGNNNIAIGTYALHSDTNCSNNVAIGNRALANNSGRNDLVAVGDSALYKNGIGALYYYEATGNTALGSKALALNTLGYYNTATGFQSIYSNTTGCRNTATGYKALFANEGGNGNTAVGYYSLTDNETGSFNTALGQNALADNQSGDYNTIVGSNAMGSSVNGNNNAVLGYAAGYGYMAFSGSNNTLVGYKAGNTLYGSNNILIGYQAGDNLYHGMNNIIIGNDIDATDIHKENEMIIGAPDLLYGDLVNKYIGIGTTSPEQQLHINNNADAQLILQADADNSGEEDNPRFEFRQDGTVVKAALGLVGTAGNIYANSLNNALYLVNEYNAALQFGTDNTLAMTISPTGKVGIGNNAPDQALHVTGSVKVSTLSTNGPVYSNGQVLTNTNPSDLRLKENVQGFGNTLDKMMQLRPVTFDWKSDGKQGIGFIAQDMESVIPELVATNEDGYKGIYTVEMIPFLVKAIQEQQAMIDQLKERLEVVESR